MLSNEDIARHAAEVREKSCTILRNIFPVSVIDAWNEAFQPLLAGAVVSEAHGPNRGAARHYVTLPFEEPWADPSILDNADVMAVVEDLVGADGVLHQLATDTPLIGSDYQELHRDTQPLFPEAKAETPPYQLAVNFPLVDVTAENGPMEFVPGSHVTPKAEAIAAVASGANTLQPILLRRGDVMIRDVRHIHRGTPNRTTVPRPMVVIGYSRRWLHRPEVQIRVPTDVLQAMPERTRRWLRFNPVFSSRQEAARSEERYRAFAY